MLEFKLELGVSKFEQASPLPDKFIGNHNQPSPSIVLEMPVRLLVSVSDPKDVNRSSVIAKHVHRWFPVTVASQALTGQTIGRYTLWVLGFIENRLGNALNANP